MMLKQAHEIMEMAGGLASAVKDERWADADRIRETLSVALEELSAALREKVRGEIQSPQPEHRDRG